MNGPESFTPDHNFILGEAPRAEGLLRRRRLQLDGHRQLGGGAGMALAEWIVAGEPTLDLWPVDIRRFAGFHGNDAWLRDRVGETLGLHYKMPWPQPRARVGRPFRRSPLYDRLAARGARVRQQDGLGAAELVRRASARRRTSNMPGARQNWFDAVAAEHTATREAVTVVDETSFAQVPGAGARRRARAAAACANDVAVPVGSTVYTGLLNARGTYESDLTIARLARGPVPDHHRLGAGGARRRLDRAQHRRGRARRR